jgi:hypothetical protein
MGQTRLGKRAWFETIKRLTTFPPGALAAQGQASQKPWVRLGSV